MITRKWITNNGTAMLRFETAEGRVIEMADLRAMGCPEHIARRVEESRGIKKPETPKADPAVDAMRARLAAQQQIHVA